MEVLIGGLEMEVVKNGEAVVGEGIHCGISGLCEKTEAVGFPPARLLCW